jgi:fructose-bisphosphate aldolase class I
MNQETLRKTVEDMVRVGILAADESHGTPEKPQTIETRLIKCGILPTDGNVIAWRELVKGTPNLRDYVSGIILEKSRVALDARDFNRAGIVPGVKVDGGTSGKVEPSGEKLTVGLDGLYERLQGYKADGARFTKWRTVTPIDTNLPTSAGIAANMGTIVKYALVCQSLDIVPIGEPEVLIDGNHTIQRSYQVTREVLSEMFEQIESQGVYKPGMVLKTSMVIYGKKYDGARDVNEVAEMTLRCLKETVPNDLGAIVFLLGGQTDLEAVQHLNAMNRMARDGTFALPWKVTFSYSRAIQDEAMKIWKGEHQNISRAQEAIIERARACALASKGELDPNFDYAIKA